MSRRPISELPDPTHDLLEAIDGGANTSQRSLARRMGIALGLTNLLVRRFVGKGWVRVTQIKPRRVRYLLTPAGLAEKARLSQQAFQNSVERYRVVRSRIQEAFGRLSAEWPAGPDDAGRKRIVFYGTGEIAEIGYICLQNTDLELVGAIDDSGRQRFFGVPVVPLDRPESLPELVAGARVVVMSLAQNDQIRADLAAMGSLDRAVWI